MKSTFHRNKTSKILITIQVALGLASAFAVSHSDGVILSSIRRSWNKHENKSFGRTGNISTIRSISSNTLLYRGGADSNDALTDGKWNSANVLENNPIEPSYNLPDGVCRSGIILVDSFCPFHGEYLDRMARKAYGAGVINVLSEYITGYLYFERGITEHISTRVPKEEEVEDWLKKIPFDIVGIVCESDSGLGDAEKLGVNLSLFPHAHDGFNEARRNKFLMNKCLSEQGMRVVRQKLCSTIEEAIDFAMELGVSNAKSHVEEDVHKFTERPRVKTELIRSGFLGNASNKPDKQATLGKCCILKPCKGVASDNVNCCQNIDQVRIAFDRIHDSSVFGSTTRGEKNEAVLVQEFAEGTEYVVDIVSKAGEHKCAALWRYDKRSVNGSPFVYFATEIIDALTPTGQAICEYAMKALDALEVRWGMSHNEFIVDKRGPRLVEVNCRQHNTDFAPLTTACIGYNALDMVLSAYLGDMTDLPMDTADLRLIWDELPDLPVSRAFGAVVHLVCHVEGVITHVNEELIEEILSLPSVAAMEIYPEFSVGSQVSKTIDIKSDSGWVHLISDDEEQFQRDYDRIVEIMPLMFSV